jgi:hypothetical protein
VACLAGARGESPPSPEGYGDQSVFALISFELRRTPCFALMRWAAAPCVARRAKHGGHDRDRTCDPYHVKVVPNLCSGLPAFVIARKNRERAAISCCYCLFPFGAACAELLAIC